MKTKFILNHIASKTIFCFLVVSLTFANAKSQVTVFSENFDGTVQPYTAGTAYTNTYCSNYVVAKNTTSAVCGGEFVSYPIAKDASGSGKFLFEGTDASGPSYAGSFYKITLNDTWVAGYTFTISFEVALGDNIAPPVLQPQINGVNIGTAITPTSINAWQKLTFVYTPSTTLIKPVFSLYNAQSTGVGNDFGVDNILITVLSLDALPVRFTSFTGQVSSQDVLLRWGTASETNNDHFEVEHSTDGINYNTIGTVKGAGNSNTVHNYSFQDNEPVNGNNFYRLKQVDNDGNEFYSTVVEEEFKAEVKAMSVFPNPAKDQFTISLKKGSNESCVVLLIDLSGKTALTLNAVSANGQIHVMLSGRVAPGIYIVRVTANDVNEFAKLIVR